MLADRLEPGGTRLRVLTGWTQVRTAPTDTA